MVGSILLRVYPQFFFLLCNLGRSGELNFLFTPSFPVYTGPAPVIHIFYSLIITTIMMNLFNG
jgi:hypothetical protein